jgi:hypothetical protein
LFFEVTAMKNPKDALTVWRIGNDHGEGFAPGPWHDDRATTVEEAVDELLGDRGSCPI